MKIQVSKRGIVALLDAALLKVEVQEEQLDSMAECLEDVVADSELKDKAIGKAKKAIAALTGTKLEGCPGEGCPGHLSKEAVELCREAIGGQGKTRLGHERFRSVIWNLEAGIATRDTKIESLEAEIERLKALPTIDHSNCIPRPTGEFDAKEAAVQHQRVWMSNSRGADYTLRNAMEDLAGEAFAAGALANERLRAEAQAALDAINTRVPQKVHVIVVPRPEPMLPFVYVFVGNDDAVRKVRELAIYPRVTCTTERVIPDSGEKLPLEEGKEAVQME